MYKVFNRLIIHIAYIVDDLMLVAFGLSSNNTGFDDVNILSISSWSWITQYTANIAWLSGKTTSTNGVARNNTGTSICLPDT